MFFGLLSVVIFVDFYGSDRPIEHLACSSDQIVVLYENACALIYLHECIQRLVTGYCPCLN